MNKSEYLLILLCASQPIVAFSATDTNDGGTLEEITVTARSRAENLQDVPDSIKAFSSEAIASYGVDEYFDFVRATPGLSIVESSQSPGIALLNIRGIGQQLNQDPPVAVIVDGVQAASPAAITQALVNVERIEVVKGPQGALYGRNAIGGAINIVSIEPGDELAGHVKFGGGTHGAELAEAVVQGPLASDSVRFSLVGRYTDYDGDFRNAYLDKETNPLKDWFTKGRIIVDVSEALRVDATYNHSETTNAGYNAVVLPGGDAGNFTPRPMSGRVGHGRRTVDEASVRVSLESALGTWTSTSAWVDSHDASGYDLDQQPPDLIDLTLQSTGINAISEEVRLTSATDQRLRYTTGVYYLDTQLERESIVTLFPPITGAPDPVSLPTSTVQNNDAWAVFGQANYDVTDRLELTLAARYDRDNRDQTDNLSGSEVQATFDSWQPKLSLAYRMTDETLLYATYAEGFRSGGFNQPTPSFPLQYKAEDTQSIEAGFKSRFGGSRLQLNGALFRTTQDNQQVTLVDVQNSGAQGIVNIDETRFTGAELEAVGLLSDALQLTVGLSYVDSEIKAFAAAPQYIGNQSPYAPEVSWVVGLDYAKDLSAQWHMALHADYAGQGGMYYEFFGSVKQPTYGLTNLRLTMSRSRYAIEVYGENIFDEGYYADVASNYVTGGLGDLGIRGRRSRAGINVSVKF